jgi:hypothetical protein
MIAPISCMHPVVTALKFERAQGRLGGVLPAERGKNTWRVRGVPVEIRRSFPQRSVYAGTDRKPVLLVKWKLSAMTQGRSPGSQMRQVLFLGSSLNGIA